MQYPSFLQIAQQGWNEVSSQTDKAKLVTAKFKNLRKVLRAWQQQLSGLKKILSHVKTVISLLETIEEFRDLTVLEWNFKEAFTEKLKQLLEQQKIYWR